jgi:hypothetical protein
VHARPSWAGHAVRAIVLGRGLNRIGSGRREVEVGREHAGMERDDDLQPWLRGLDEAQLAQIAVDLTYAICRPSFGSLSKRELEQVTFSCSTSTVARSGAHSVRLPTTWRSRGRRRATWCSNTGPGRPAQ